MTQDQLKTQAEWFFAFEEPTRNTLIRALGPGEKTVTDLAKLEKSVIVKVSHHLKILKGAGIVAVERDGRFRRY